jgi:hypothetical protein
MSLFAHRLLLLLLYPLLHLLPLHPQFLLLLLLLLGEYLLLRLLLLLTVQLVLLLLLLFLQLCLHDLQLQEAQMHQAGNPTAAASHSTHTQPHFVTL